jgi:hypothetical protein
MMTVTRLVENRLLRLPLWVGLEDHQQRVIDALMSFKGYQ